ncbi:MAG: hypothetical protein KDI77_17550, partial [Gammaproteobacteria bacterium]|nr:hypothetical protein [Gammaproteobacteria bacterium]
MTAQSPLNLKRVGDTEVPTKDAEFYRRINHTSTPALHRDGTGHATWALDTKKLRSIGCHAVFCP